MSSQWGLPRLVYNETYSYSHRLLCCGAFPRQTMKAMSSFFGWHFYSKLPTQAHSCKDAVKAWRENCPLKESSGDARTVLSEAAPKDSVGKNLFYHFSNKVRKNSNNYCNFLEYPEQHFIEAQLLKWFVIMSELVDKKSQFK